MVYTEKNLRNCFTNNQNMIVETGDNFSFNFTSSSKEYDWMVIKFYSSSSFKLKELNFSGEAVFNKGRGEIMEFIFTNFNETYHWNLGSQYVSPWDSFIHIGIGKINYTRNHLKYYNSTEPTPFWMKWYDINATFGKGYWYFIGYVAPSDNASLNLHLEGIGNLEIKGVAEGNSTYLCGMEDFLGTINVWNRMVLLTLNGEKKVNIENNLFVAHFEPCAGAGFIKLEYVSPQKERYSVFYRITGIWDIFVYFKKDFDIWTPFMKKGTGEWTIKFSAFVRHDLQSIISHYRSSEYPIPPESAYIAVADIKLP